MRVTLQAMGVLPQTKVLGIWHWEPGLSVGAVEGGRHRRHIQVGVTEPQGATH